MLKPLPRPAVTRSGWAVLSGARFALACVVAVSHLASITPLPPALRLVQRFNSIAAVVGFLLISGYSIAASLEREPHGYFRRRLLRIYPLYAASLLLGLTPFLLFGDFLPIGAGSYSMPRDPLTFPAHFFFLQMFLVRRFEGAGQLWTVSVEFAYYAIAPFILRLRPMWIAAFMLASATLYIFHDLVRVDHLPDAHGGRAAALLFWSWLLGFAHHRWRRGITAILLLFLPSILFLIWNQDKDQNLAQVTLLAVGGLLVMAPNLKVPARAIPILNFLGDLSYPLYVVHIAIYLLATSARPETTPLEYLVAAMVAAAIFYVAIDYPIRAKKAVR